ncbi:MAG TPA: hypothetical protein VF132_07140 [Rudaea sp.]
MGTHIGKKGGHIMKTTLEINDELFRSARDHVEREGTTLRSLVEQGLRMVLAASAKQKPRKKLKIHVFKGEIGFTDEFRNADWAAIKEEARRR